MPKQSPRLGAKRGKNILKIKHKSADYKYMYNWQWRKASKAFREQNPLCVCAECAQRVVPLPSEVTDHVIPHKGDETLFWDRKNWQALAKVCHDKKTAIEDGGFGR